jgi:hypothetical protein
MSSFEELAERCEQASGDDRTGLNAEIAAVVGWQRITPSQMGRGHRSKGGWIAPEDYSGRHSDGKPILDSLHGTVIHRDPPPFTASLDAAMTLVPDGLTIVLQWRFDWRAEVGYANVGNAVSGPLALCAAALRARAASCDGRPKGGDSTEIEAPFTTSAVPKGDAQNTLSNGIEP